MMPVFWYNLIEERSKDLTDKEVIEIAFRALNLLMPKVLVIPATPNDSVNNAELLHALEARNALPATEVPSEERELDSKVSGDAD